MKNTQHKQCPVCGMDIINNNYPLEHYKVIYQFCSSQCRENFNDHPSLYLGSLARPNVEIIKSRRIRLSASPSPKLAGSIKDNLQQLMGVKDLQLDGRSIRIRYDLKQATFAQIERSLENIGFILDDAWWRRFKRGLIKYIESNELENLATPQVACCNRPPPRA